MNVCKRLCENLHKIRIYHIHNMTCLETDTLLWTIGLWTPWARWQPRVRERMSYGLHGIGWQPRCSPHSGFEETATLPTADGLWAHRARRQPRVRNHSGPGLHALGGCRTNQWVIIFAFDLQRKTVHRVNSGKNSENFDKPVKKNGIWLKKWSYPP